MKAFITLLFFVSINVNVLASQILKFAELKKLSEQTTAQHAFDEAINISANFSINQIDPDLKPYFSPTTQKSNLCVPTTLANFLIYQMAVTKQLPISTNVPGVSADLQTIDANQLIIDLLKKCKTDFDNGTNQNNVVACLGDITSLYFNKKVKIKRIVNDVNAINQDYVEFENRRPDLKDIRDILKTGSPVIASVGWNSFDPQTNKWVYTNGHVFGIYGYSWKKYFGDNILQLDISDPEYVWQVPQDTSVFNIASGIRMRDDPNSSIFLDGRGFNGQFKRGFLGSLLQIQFY
jgi:hypothetical protein